MLLSRVRIAALALFIVFSLILPYPIFATSVSNTPSVPVMRDASGNNLSSASIGQLVVISTTIVNNRDAEMPFVAFIEVRDGKGVTVYLQWQMGTMNPDGQSEVGLSWVPESAGTYQFRTFFISDLLDPQILSPIASGEATVTS